MKKKLAVTILVCTLSALLLSGCLGSSSNNANANSTPNYPTWDDMEDFAEAEACGENVYFDANSNYFRSKDRDLKFSVNETEQTASLDGSLAQGTGQYWLASDYDGAVHYYWHEEYEKAINSHKFYYSFYHTADPDNYYFMDCGVELYIDEDCTEAQLAEVEGLFYDLREICKKEQTFHTSEYDFNYYVSLSWVDSATDTKKFTNDIYISADSTDEELSIDSFVCDGSEVVLTEQPVPIDYGYSFIVQFGPSRQRFWKY